MISLPLTTPILPSRCLLHKTRRQNSTRRRLLIRSSSSLQDQFTVETTKRVVLVRHGQSTWNEEGRIQGSSDFSVLTKKGESQAEISRQMLIDDSFDVCFTRSCIFLLYLLNRYLKSSHLDLDFTSN